MCRLLEALALVLLLVLLVDAIARIHQYGGFLKLVKDAF